MRKMFKKVFGTILAASLLLGSLSGGVLAEKTYTDAEKWGFETDWTPYKDSIPEVDVIYNTDKANVLQGERSLKLIGNASSTVGVTTTYDQLETESGKTQYVIGKIKADLDEGSTLVVGLYNKQVTYEISGNSRKVAERKFTADCDWTDIYLDGSSLYIDNGEVVKMYVSIMLSGTGTVYADDFALVEDDNMTRNPEFIPASATSVQGWATQSGRGVWGRAWNYEDGALKLVRTADVEWLYTAVPYANKMVSGEIYKVSIRYKADSTTNLPAIYVLYSAPDRTKYTLSHCGVKVTLSPVGEVVADQYTDYVGYFTLPADKTHYGYAIMGTVSKSAAKKTSYYDDFYVEKDKTSAPIVTDADADSTIEAGEIVTAKMHLAEKEEKNVHLIIAVYSKDGNATVFEAVNFADFAVGPEIENDYSTNGVGDIEVSVTVPDAEKEYTAKAFCWDADNRLTPLP